jgi:formiminoglutamase
MLRKSQIWKGRNDGDAEECLRWHQVMQYEIYLETKAAIIGFSCDEGVRRNKGRIGAKNGPQALRMACANFPVHKVLNLVDLGDVVCDDQNLEVSQIELAEKVAEIQRKGIKSLVLGGGHEVMYGHFKGIRSAFPNKKIGIINFDAHFDNRKVEPGIGATSGTGFWQIAKEDANYEYLAIGIQRNSNTQVLFDEASRTSTEYILADDFIPENEKLIFEKIEKWAENIDVLYVTICLDVFASPFAPGVSATAYNGIFPDYFFRRILRKVLKSEKLRAFDIAELNPDYDIDNRTAKLAASFVFELVNA